MVHEDWKMEESGRTSYREGIETCCRRLRGRRYDHPQDVAYLCLMIERAICRKIWHAYNTNSTPHNMYSFGTNFEQHLSNLLDDSK